MNQHKANILMIEEGKKRGAKTAFERAEELKPCPFGEYGTCCKLCALGPCRINPKRADSMRGICGADANTIAARNFARMIAAGTAAHTDHGRQVAKAFLATARGEIPGYEIKDERKLKMIAQIYGVEVKDRS